MIKQLSEHTFSFTYTEIPPSHRWGEDQELDHLGVTSHLLPTVEITDKEQYNWILENNMPFKIKSHIRLKYLEFKNSEDAMAFKLRWL